jgi:uroporphyrinogen III methyltransferase/synthase
MSGLSGRKVLVTRAREDAAELAERLVARGAEPVFFPTIERKPPPDPAAARGGWLRARTADRVLVGSPAALAAWADLEPPPAPIRVACVGAATAEKVRSAWPERFHVAEVATSRRAEGLRDVLVAALGAGGRLEGRRFVFPRAPEGRTTLIEALEALGAEVEPVITYRVGCAAAPDASRVEDAEVLTFLSGRTLECFLEVLGDARGRGLLAARRVAVIGPVAAARAAALGIRVDVVPGTASAEALVEALDEGA